MIGPRARTRRSGGVDSLTDEGAVFLEDCQRILAELEEAEAAVSERSARATGHLLVSAPAGFGRQHVAPLVPSFLLEHRDVTLNLNLDNILIMWSSFLWRTRALAPHIPFAVLTLSVHVLVLHLVMSLAIQTRRT